MSDNLKASLQKLRDLAPKVNQACDDATRVVREIEKFLNDSKLTVSGQVNVYRTQHENGPPNYTDTDLFFGRVKDHANFRIAVREVDLDESMDYCKIQWETPWLECARNIKLETFPSLPDLLANIGEEVEKSIKNVEAAMPEIEKLLASLK